MSREAAHDPAVGEEHSPRRTRKNRDALVADHLGLAVFFARRYRGRGVEDDDLEQTARLALVRAAERFDPDLGVSFSTFAGRTIDGELKRWFRDRAWAARVPRSLQERSLQVRRATEDLTNTLSRTPRPAEIAEHLELDLDQVLEALDVRDAYRPPSLDAPRGGDDDQPAAVVSTDDARARATVEDRMITTELLERLPERERQILTMRYFDERTQSEIADELGISQMHVSRLIRRSLEQLRAGFDIHP